MTDSGKKFCVEYAKRGTAGCKKCKVKIDTGLLRIGKIIPNPFTESGGDMKEWYHVDCIFEAFTKARATTKKIEESDELDGFQNIEKDDRKMIIGKIDNLQDLLSSKGGAKTPKKAAPKKATPTKTPPKKATPVKGVKREIEDEEDSPQLDKKPRLASPKKSANEVHKDNSFKEFRRICAKVYDEPSYNSKTAIVKDFLKNGTSGKGFEGDTLIWVRFLLPMVNKRVYNLQSKQLCKLYARIFGGPIYDDMVEDLEQGDVAETIAKFHEDARKCPPAKKATLSLQHVDRLLDRLSNVTREDDQVDVLTDIAKVCTSNDLKMVIRLIKHDIRINAGPKHILDAVNPAAYEAFQASLDLEEVISKSLAEGFGEGTLTVGIKVCTPIRPMLAEPCRSVEYAFKKCPNGIFAEVKYDGERVQLHKDGKKFMYFSRSLKPVVAHKVNHFKDYIPKAFPTGDSLIIDGEILLVNKETDEILPFGTLGAHKKEKFKDASVCLFVFDCLFYNGKSLLDRPIKERREIMLSQMVEIKHHVMFSDMEVVKSPSRLKGKIEEAINKGLEGLVLKDPLSKYEPGKRHWLKVKKDYLEGGKMADTADLVVLGAYFGTGAKGGIMSIFLMGCFNKTTNMWCTVTKVHGGHDDQTLARLQKVLKMKKISKNSSLVPDWLDVKSQLIPDFVAEDPETSQVWEITGAEFSKSDAHTADGISIRFPRVTRIRDDKAPEDATSLSELKQLFKTSKEQVLKLDEDCDDDEVEMKEENSGEDTAPKASSSRESNGGTTSVKKPLVKKEDEDEVHHVAVKKAISLNDAKDSRIPACDLPLVFTGIVIESLPKDFKYYEDLVRYFVAYDGKISRKDVTHQIAGLTGPKRRGYVSVDWLWESIKRRKLQDVDKYKIK